MKCSNFTILNSLNEFSNNAFDMCNVLVTAILFSFRKAMIKIKDHPLLGFKYIKMEMEILISTGIAYVVLDNMFKLQFKLISS